jgi:hypothetical protein
LLPEVPDVHIDGRSEYDVWRCGLLRIERTMKSAKPSGQRRRFLQTPDSSFVKTDRFTFSFLREVAYATDIFPVGSP